MEKDKLISKVLPLEKKIDYKFKNKNLLLKSMLHSSFVHENIHLQLKSNERLEFLGDAVLELVISEYLILNLKDKNEGILSLKRSALVREDSLAKLAKKLRIQNFVLLGKGEKKDKGFKRDSVLSDTFEALIGAIFLDGGLISAQTIILKIFETMFKKLHKIEYNYNFKNQLQEYSQSKYKEIPKYKLIKETGPDHNKKFKVSVYIKNKYITCGSGSSIKKAEQMASKNSLNLINTKRVRIK